MKLSAMEKAGPEGMILQVANIEVGYHKKLVIFGISMEIENGELTALAGPNGAGKTTALHCFVGLVHPRKGSIFYKGENITHRKASENARKGISLVPQGGRAFSDLTVLENLELGGYSLDDPKELAVQIQFVYSLFPVLEARKSQMARSLSGGERQMLSIGRALMLIPELLLLDEPSTGLAPIVVKEVMKTIKHLNQDKGMTVLVVEQNVREVFSIAQKAYVMKVGKIVLESNNPTALLTDEELRKSYLT